VDALELLADADHVVLGVRNHARQELAGVKLDGQLFAWLRAARAQPTEVDALELLADADHVVLGVRNHARQELAGVKLDGQLFTVFTVRDGQIVHLHDHAHRTEALSEAGLDYRWR
jgi:hypothetical protein